MRQIFFVTAAAAVALTAGPACAQSSEPDVTIKVEKIAPGVAVLFGQGGNIGLSYGEDGNALIDDQFAPLSDKIKAAVATVDPDPVAFVVNTHFHGDHTGGNENFGKGGSVIVAHDNVRARLAVEKIRRGRTEPPSPKAALPVITFAKRLTLHLNGDDLDVVHVANAHTDGDAIIHFRKANVLHMGDTFFHKVTLPYIDLASGGSIDGAIAAIDTALTLANDQTRVIPGHGPVALRADLAAYGAMLKDIRAKVAAAKAAGKTVEQVKADNPAKPYEIKGGFISAEEFAAVVFASIP
jgi:cyclase